MRKKNAKVSYCGKAGKKLFELKNYDKAIEYYNKGLELELDNVECLKGKAKSLSRYSFYRFKTFL